MTGPWLLSYIVLWLLFLVVAIVLLGVLRNLGVLYESIQTQSATRSPLSKLVNGQILPETELQSLSGAPISLATFAGEKTAFLIMSPSCGPCRALLSDVGNAVIDLDPLDPTVQRAVLLSLGEASRTAEFAQQSGVPPTVPILIDAEGVIVREWGIAQTPTTVIVNEQQQIVRQIFGSGEQSNVQGEAHPVLVGLPQYVGQD
jgi:thiol-disulfide isomerase/thioredoxin